MSSRVVVVIAVVVTVMSLSVCVGFYV